VLGSSLRKVVILEDDKWGIQRHQVDLPNRLARKLPGLEHFVYAILPAVEWTTTFASLKTLSLDLPHESRRILENLTKALAEERFPQLKVLTLHERTMFRDPQVADLAKVVGLPQICREKTVDYWVRETLF
jgi:hypothetical protein